MTTRVTSKGQLVIPAPLRRKLGIRKGTPMVVTERDGGLFLEPQNREYFDKLAGILPREPSLAQELVREHAQEREKEDQ